MNIFIVCNNLLGIAILVFSPFVLAEMSNVPVTNVSSPVNLFCRLVFRMDINLALLLLPETTVRLGKENWIRIDFKDICQMPS